MKKVFHNDVYISRSAMKISVLAIFGKNLKNRKKWWGKDFLCPLFIIYYLLRHRRVE